MGALLDQAAERDEPLAYLWASESPIYGRFGYGMASFCAEIEVSPARSRFVSGTGRPAVASGPCRDDQALPLMRPLYDEVAADPTGHDRGRRPTGGRGSSTSASAMRTSRCSSACTRATRVCPTATRSTRSSTTGCTACRRNELKLEHLIANGPRGHRSPLAIRLRRRSDRHREGLGPAARRGAPLARRRTPASALHGLRRPLGAPDRHPGVARRAPILRRRPARLRDRRCVPARDLGSVRAGRRVRRGAACERTDAEPELSCGVGALGAAYLGGVSFRQLARAQQVRELEPGALATSRRDVRLGSFPLVRLHLLNRYHDLSANVDQITTNADYPNGQSPNIATVAADGSDLQMATTIDRSDSGAFAGCDSPNGRWIVFRVENPATERFPPLQDALGRKRARSHRGTPVRPEIQRLGVGPALVLCGVRDAGTQRTPSASPAPQPSRGSPGGLGSAHGPHPMAR